MTGRAATMARAGRAVRVLAAALLGGAVLLAGAGTAFAQAHPMAGPRLEPEGGYKVERGPFEVRVTDDLVLKDEQRGKDLRVKVRVPVAKGGGPMEGDGASRPAYPLAIFSHGLGGSKDVFPDLCDHLASHGFVVVACSHADSVQERRRDGEKVTRDNAFDLRLMNPEKRAERVGDISFIIDSVATLEKECAGLGELATVDRAKIVLLGHSAGAYTTQLASGMKVRDRENPAGEARPEKRIRVSVVISGQGVNRVAIREDAWSEIEIPMLVITGSLDTSTITSEVPATRRHPFEKSRGTAKGGPPVYLLWIEGATHASFGGKGATAVLRERPTTPVEVIQECTHSAVLAFLDAHLRGNDAGRAYLVGEGMKALSEGRATISAK
ncbi:MAG: hypothetical protein SFY69_03525 [Planctomycetota bacterium]|nr:hypothetical protein [Planctomycetota bacterium]